MSREIKFKIWDKKENKWLTDPRISFVHSETSWGNEFYLEVDDDWMGDEYDPNRYVFCQFTGVEDKNSQGIYDGDCVIYSTNTKNGKVFSTAIIDHEQQGNWFNGLERFEVDELEVVGNLHENSKINITKLVELVELLGKKAY